MSRRDLPTGTVTFLFTDMEGSTRLAQELGDGYRAVLRDHRRLLQAAFAEHNGVEVDTQGDAFFVAFGSASDAVKAAIDAQAALAMGPVRVRMGLHTGEAFADGERYVGVDIHRAARICAAGHGGQVLLSASTAPLVDVDLHDLGEHRLKDLFVPMRLYQVGHAEFPPLRTLTFTNLPVQGTPLIGRERELSEVLRLLRDHRLVTLVGAGGTGKTRLALQVAADASDDFPDGVFWVPLAEIRDVQLVSPALAQAAGIIGDVAERIGGKRMLFVVDNFEQVVAAATQLAALLEKASSVKLLVTSREPLRVTTEWEYPVPPLPQGDAVALFTDRARALRPGFNADTSVAEICGALDGLPLAIELAASRIQVLTPDQILQRLSRKLGLLTSSARDAPQRQQTLRATIDWSHALLNPNEQRLFARLAIFSGGWTLEAAESVCGADLDVLESLVAKSLITHEQGRFGMLETIREYAVERLDELGSGAELADRHADFFLSFAERVEPDAARGEVAAWTERSDEDRNIRRAIDHLAERGRGDLEQRLVSAAWLLWFVQSRWDECLRRLTQAAEASLAPTPARAKVLRAAAWIAGRKHDVATAARFGDEALRVARDVGDDRLIGFVLRTLSVLEHWNPEGDPGRKGALVDEAMRYSRASGDTDGVSALLNNAAIDARWEGDYRGAFERSSQAVALDRESGNRRALCVALPHLADAERLLGDNDAAKAHLAEALLLSRDLDFREKLIEVIHNLAVVCASAGDFGWSAALFGAAQRENTFGWLPEDVATAREYEEARAAAITGLGEAEFDRAFAAGRAMSLDVVHDYLRHEQRELGSPVDPDAALALVSGLTRIRMSDYAVVGNYLRFDDAVRESLADVRQSIAIALAHPGQKRNAHLIWAAPGSGKTYFVQQVAEFLPDTRFATLNLASSDETAMRELLQGDGDGVATRRLCFVDECDAQPAYSPYELLLPALDEAVAASQPVVFVFAGSAGSSVVEMQQLMGTRPKGPDLLSRIPHENVHTITPLGIGDRVLVAIGQLCAAAAEGGRHIASVERMALFYVSVDGRLGSPRQLRELCVRAVERMLPSEERLRYDHLFSPGNPENKSFWLQWQARHGSLVNQFVAVEDS